MYKMVDIRARPGREGGDWHDAPSSFLVTSTFQPGITFVITAATCPLNESAGGEEWWIRGAANDMLRSGLQDEKGKNVNVFIRHGR